MSENIKKGLVGFFDILGYQNLLERNEPELIAEKVLPILKGIRTNGKDDLYKHFDLKTVTLPEQKRKMGLVIASMDWLVFSDTILLSLPFDKSDSSLHYYYWLAFLRAARNLQIKLFEAGLPVRGAIAYGEFLVEDAVFAGRCIVEAYQLSSKVEMAGCVLSETAFGNFLDNDLETARSVIARAYLAEYLVATKDGEQHMQTVIASPPSTKIASGIHKAVMNAFWGNGKDISQSVRPKIHNTIQWLEYLEEVVESRKRSKAV